MTPRMITADLVTTNLPAAIRAVAEQIAGESGEGERYVVSIRISGPLTVEETVTALWGKVRVVQIPVT